MVPFCTKIPSSGSPVHHWSQISVLTAHQPAEVFGHSRFWRCWIAAIGSYPRRCSNRDTAPGRPLQGARGFVAKKICCVELEVAPEQLRPPQLLCPVSKTTQNNEWWSILLEHSYVSPLDPCLKTGQGSITEYQHHAVGTAVLHPGDRWHAVQQLKSGSRWKLGMFFFAVLGTRDTSPRKGQKRYSFLIQLSDCPHLKESHYHGDAKRQRMEADLLWWNDSTASGEGANPNPRHLTRPRLRFFLSLDVREAVSVPTQKMQKRGELWWPKMTRSSEQSGENTAGDVQGTAGFVAFPTPHSVDWSHCASPKFGMFTASVAVSSFKMLQGRCGATCHRIWAQRNRGPRFGKATCCYCKVLHGEQHVKAPPSIPAIRKPMGLKIGTDWITWTDLDIGFGAWTSWNWKFVSIGSRQDAIFKRDPPTLGRDVLEYQGVWRQRLGSNVRVFVEGGIQFLHCISLVWNDSPRINFSNFSCSLYLQSLDFRVSQNMFDPNWQLFWGCATSVSMHRARLGTAVVKGLCLRSKDAPSTTWIHLFIKYHQIMQFQTARNVSSVALLRSPSPNQPIHNILASCQGSMTSRRKGKGKKAPSRRGKLCQLGVMTNETKTEI